MKTYYIEDFVNSRKLAVVDDGDLVDLIIEKNDASEGDSFILLALKKQCFQSP